MSPSWSEEKASRFPSGDQVGWRLRLSNGENVSCWGLPDWKSRTAISNTRFMDETYAIFVPSGDKEGCKSRPSEKVSRSGCCPGNCLYISVSLSWPDTNKICSSAFANHDTKVRLSVITTRFFKTIPPFSMVKAVFDAKHEAQVIVGIMWKTLTI